MTDFRALCAELLEAWEHELGELAADNRLVKRTRTALAQPDQSGEVGELLQAALASFKLTQDPADYPADHWSRRATELLDRSRRQPEQAADGEVGELVNSLRHSGDALRIYGLHGGADDCTRAADLLERQQQMEDLAADAVNALRYIEQQHGRLYGVGFDRVYEKADRLQPPHPRRSPLVRTTNGLGHAVH
jgi:NTP pyrophosphatase (non-canonical NTP hydrolase)